MSFRYPKTRLKKNQWLTGEGRIVNIKDMDDQHLINTLNYVESHAALYEDRAEQYVNMLEEAKRRGYR